MRLGAFLRWLSNETGVSVVASSALDDQPVTVDVVEQGVSDILTVVARRLGVQVTRTGTLFYLGELRPEDRGVLVRRVRRLNEVQLKTAIAAFGSENGRVTTFEDGLVVVADRVEVLQRVHEMLDRVEASSTDTWVIQFSIISLVDSDLKRLGFQVEPLIDVAASFGAGSGVGVVKAASLTAGLSAVLDVARESSSSRIVGEPLVIIGDGRTANLTDGRKIPIAKRTVSPEGTVSITGFDFVDTGLQLTAGLREQTTDEALITVKVSLSEVIGFVAGEAPITSATTFDTVATIRSGGVYLVGSVVRRSHRDLAAGGLETVKETVSDHSTVQLWCRAFRIGAPSTK